MMMKITEILHCRDISVYVDKYVPFKVLVESGDLSPPYYWRAGDGRVSLIEIGLSSSSGAIRSITLTSIGSDQVFRANSNVLEAKVPEVNGLPAFDMSYWSFGNCFSNIFLDEIPFNIRLLTGSDYVSLEFEKVAKPDRFVTNRNIRFGIAANGELSTIDLLGLTQQQLSTIDIATG
jgi:hypothetical protein